MFSTTTRLLRLAFKSLRPTRNVPRSTVRSLTTRPSYQNSTFPVYLIPTLGFSVFTWIGFDNDDKTPEDDLIMSIKHSILLIRRLEYDKAEQLLHVSLRQAQQLYNDLGITYIYDIMANLALQREQLEKAKKLFVSVSQRLMSKGVKEDDPRIIHISLKLARISHLMKEHTVAQLGFEWCISKLHDEFKKNPTDETNKLLALAEDWYGRLFLECNEGERGLQLLLSSHERSLQLSDIEGEHIVIQLNDIATVCEELNRLDDSEQYLQEAIERGKDLNEMKDLGAVYVNLGRLYIKKNMLEEARKTCGYGWRLGHDRKNDEVKQEAQQCIKEVIAATLK